MDVLAFYEVRAWCLAFARHLLEFRLAVENQSFYHFVVCLSKVDLDLEDLWAGNTCSVHVR